MFRFFERLRHNFTGARAIFLYVLIPVLIAIALEVSLAIYLSNNPEKIDWFTPRTIIVEAAESAEKAQRLQAYRDNFIASLWEDILFFSTAGMISLALSFFVSLRSVPITERISRLFSSNKITNESSAYVASKIDHMLVFGRKAKIEIFVTSYDSILNAFRLEVWTELHLQNMVKDADYNGPFNFKLFFDDYDPPSSVYEYRGGIIELLLNGTNGSDDEQWLVKPTENFKGLTYSIKRNISIAPNATRKFKYRYWAWNIIGSPLIIDMVRYTENIEIVLHNAADSIPLGVCLSQDGSDVTKKTIMPSGNATLAEQFVVTPDTGPVSIMLYAKEGDYLKDEYPDF